MRAVLQRVRGASVESAGRELGRIGRGLLVYLAVLKGDSPVDVRWLVEKSLGLRLFSDEQGKMNLSLFETGGEMLVVSQFTLAARTKKGARPSFSQAAPPAEAVALYREFIDTAAERLSQRVAGGEFGALMQVRCVNDGPVTIWMDSKARE